MVQKKVKDFNSIDKKFITVFQKHGKKTKSAKLIDKLLDFKDLKNLNNLLSFKLIKFYFGSSKIYQIKFLTTKQKLSYSLYLYKSLLKKKHKISSFKLILNEFNNFKKGQGLLYKICQNLIKQALANRILI